MENDFRFNLTGGSGPAESLLNRGALPSRGLSGFSPLQSQVDGLVGGFVQGATDWKSLTSMVLGGMAYRTARIGVMGLGSGNTVRAVSVGLGLAAEVSTFEMAYRGLQSAGENANLWRWNGISGIRQGLLHSFITFGSLKSVGRATRSENLFVQHLLQDTAIVAGHQISGALNITTGPTGTLAEQFLHAEATNLQLSAGMALAFRAAPGIHGLERGLNLSIQRDDGGPPLPRRFQPEEVWLEAAPQGMSAISRGPHDSVLNMIQYKDPMEGASGVEAGPLNLRPLRRGGVMVQTSQGWIQFGVPMWTNKDAYQIYLDGGGAQNSRPARERIPTIYILDPDYLPATDGMLPADFVQYLHFFTQQTTFTLVTPDRGGARRLKNFLDLSYLGPSRQDLSKRVRREYPPDAIGVPNMAEENRSFPASHPEMMRQIRCFNSRGVLNLGSVQIRKQGSQVYEIHDSGASRRIDLREYPLPSALSGSPSAAVEGILQRIFIEGRPGLWPIGTAHGFSPGEETSGFMIWNRGKMVLVDPPSSTVDHLLSHRIPLSAVDGVLLSHGHTDHYGNAVPQLLEALPRLNLYTTPTILQMLQRQYHLAVGRPKEGLAQWNFIPLLPQRFTQVLGLSLRPEYSYHPVPTLGFEIYDRPDTQGRLVLLFTGDTYADHTQIWQRLTPVEGGRRVASPERIAQILRHIELLHRSRGQSPPPVMLIEGGRDPIHTPPARTREILDQAAHEGIDISRVKVYHIADPEAETANVPKWKAGPEGFIDLSDYF